MKKNTKSISIAMFIGIAMTATANAQNITGSGTNNYVLKFTSTGSTAGNSSIFDNGNIGIGLTAPGAKFEVAGAGSFLDPSGLKNTLQIGNNGSICYITATAYAGGSYTPITFSAGSGGERMRIATDGKVGIGTTSASQKLEIKHNDSNGGIVINRDNATNANSEIKFSRQGTQKWAIGNDLAGDGSQNFFIWNHASTTAPMFINSSGKVGIGTTAPNAKVHIQTNYTGNYDYGIITQVTGGTSENQYRTKAIAVLDNAGGDQFIVWGDGYVHAREFKVTIGSFTHSDYVFADDYNLMPLTDLKGYLKKNKHLPGVPSNADVEKNNGINLGEMTEANLAKTEELYLYMLQLNEIILKVQSENEALKTKVEKLENKGKQ